MRRTRMKSKTGLHAKTGHSIRKLDDSIPLGRMAKPEQIATLVASLAGDRASYVTATTIFADGGLMQSSAGL